MAQSRGVRAVRNKASKGANQKQTEHRAAHSAGPCDHGVTTDRPVDGTYPRYTIGDFLGYMRNRMDQSRGKYGELSFEKAKLTDQIRSMIARVKKYEQTGNTEWLVDAANFLMIEFLFPQHHEAHFRATSSSESPGVVLSDGQVAHRLV